MSELKMPFAERGELKVIDHGKSVTASIGHAGATVEACGKDEDEALLELYKALSSLEAELIAARLKVFQRACERAKDGHF